MLQTKFVLHLRVSEIVYSFLFVGYIKAIAEAYSV